MQHTPSEDGQTEIENESTKEEEVNNEEIEQDIEEEQQFSDDQDQDSDMDLDDDGETFASGQKLLLVRVRFPGNSRPHTFLVGKRTYSYGQRVVAMSDRGLSVGYVNSFPYEISYHENMGKFRPINRAATDEDLKEQQDHLFREREADLMCKQLIDQHQLDMTLTHVEFLQNGKKAVFYFNAPNRVDFRALVKDLVAKLRMRVELRQISVRDRTAAIGAIGVCGLQTCCSSFLKNYGSVSIKMAKNQNLALIPTKINGVCGQIKCCMKYEDAVYVEKKKILPKEGSIIETIGGDRGKVYRIHILIEQFEMLTDQGRRRRYAVNQYDPNIMPPEDYRFPRELPFIQDETHTIVGLEDEATKAALEFQDSEESLFSDEDIEMEDNSPEEEAVEAEPVKQAQAPRTNENNNGENRPKRRRGGRNRRGRRGGNGGGNNNSGPAN